MKTHAILEQTEGEPTPTAKDVARAQTYVNRIKNPNKRHYAGLYLEFLRGSTYQPDASKAGISYMAAQGVRLSLLHILGL